MVARRIRPRGTLIKPKTTGKVARKPTKRRASSPANAIAAAAKRKGPGIKSQMKAAVAKNAPARRTTRPKKTRTTRTSPLRGRTTRGLGRRR